MTALRATLIAIGLFYAVVSGVAEHRYRAAMQRGNWAAVPRAARLWPLSARIREGAATLPALRDEVAPAAAIAALRRELRWRPHEPKLLFWLSYQCWRLAADGEAWSNVLPAPAGFASPSEAQACALANLVTLRRLAPRWPQTKLLGELLFHQDGGAPERGGRAWDPEPDHAFGGEQKERP